MRLVKIAGEAATVGDAIPKLAQRLLDGVCCPPTDLDALCSRLGIVEVRAEDIPFSGELRPVLSGFVVIYGKNLSKERRRFTIAHETAHALLETGGPRCPKRGEELERICDMWATEILMPTQIFSLHYRKDFSTDHLLDLARMFEVSLSAAALRCKELFGISVFEVADKEVKWGFGVVSKGPIRQIYNDDIRTAIGSALEGQSGERLLFLHKGGVPQRHFISYQPLLRRERRALLLIKKAVV